MNHRTLYIKYRLDVFKMCLYMVKNYQDAEDLTQDIFTKVLKTDLNHIQEPKHWMIRVTMNECKNFLRKKKYIPLDQLSQIFRHLKANETIDKQLLNTEAEDQLLKALSTLPDQTRVIFILRYFQELPLQDIATIMNIPLGTVKSRLHKGTKKFKATYKEQRHSIFTEGLK